MAEKDTIGNALTRLVIYVVVAVVVFGILNWVFYYLIPDIVAKYPGLRGLGMIVDFAPYIFVIVALVIGWMIISSIASLIYAMIKVKYDVSTALAVKNMVKILGLGGLFATIAGGIAGGVAGVALGGFIGMVVGFATQQVLGQAIAGLFLLLARPFKIGDNVDMAGETDLIVKEIGALFTITERRSDSNTVLIPSTMIIGQKIVIRKKRP